MEKALRYSAMEDAPPPVITTAPHPRELARGLQARQLEGETCGFFEADPGTVVTCSPGYLCARNTILGAAFCCASTDFPTCSYIRTACYDSTDVISSCGSSCFSDLAILKCTRSFSSYCEVDLYSYADQTSLYTGFLCTNVPGTSTVLPFFTTDSSTVEFSFLPSEATVPSFVPLNPSQASTKSENTVALVSPTGSLTPTLPNPVVPATATSASSTPVHHAGLSGGAIAGIVVGALGAIVIIVGMLLFFLYFRRRDDKRQSMVSSQQPVNNQTGYAAPPMSQQPHQPSSNQLNPSSAPSYASPTSSTHPLAPQQPQSPSLQQQQYQSPMGVGVSNQDLGPGDSASQIGGPTNAYGQHQPPPAHEGSGNYFTSPSQSGAGGSPSGSPPQSGLGALPGQFQHQHSYGGGGQVPESTIGPGTAFQSIPPVRAPGVPGSPPGSPPPPASPLQQQQQHGGVSYMGGPQTQGSYIPGRGGTNEMQG